MSAIILVYGRVVGIHLYTPSIPYWTSPIVLLFHIYEEIILLIEKAEWFYSMRRLRYNRCLLYVIRAHIYYCNNSVQTPAYKYGNDLESTKGGLIQYNIYVICPAMLC